VKLATYEISLMMMHALHTQLNSTQHTQTSLRQVDDKQALLMPPRMKTEDHILILQVHKVRERTMKLTIPQIQ
jgi:hypothetical protein